MTCWLKKLQNSVVNMLFYFRCILKAYFFFSVLSVVGSVSALGSNPFVPHMSSTLWLLLSIVVFSRETLLLLETKTAIFHFPSCV